MKRTLTTSLSLYLLLALITTSFTFLSIPEGTDDPVSVVNAFDTEKAEGGNRGFAGEIDSNTTWAPEDSPVNITGNTTVRPGTVLTVEPGVAIVFRGNYSLAVEGSLNCSGSYSSPVLFTSDSSGSRGARLRLNDSSYGRINATVFVNVTGIVWEGNGSIANSTFRNCSLPLTFRNISSDGNHTVVNTTFVNSGERDISLDGSDVSVLDIAGSGSPALDARIDNASILRLWKTFHIRVLKDTLLPLSGCHVKVANATDVTYATTHFGGNDSATDDNGEIRDIEMLANVSGGNWWKNETANISLYMKEKGEWENSTMRNLADVIPRTTFEFVSDDLYSPAPPANLTILQLNNTALNISWEPSGSPDIVVHSVHLLDETEQWAEIANVSTSFNHTQYSGIAVGKRYFFKLRAWDDAGHGSNFSETRNITAADIESPKLLGYGPNGTNVSRMESIAIRFSEPMDKLSVRGAFTIYPTAMHLITFEDNGTVLNATPYTPMFPSTRYTIRLNSSAADPAGNTLGHNLTFTFVTVKDEEAPYVVKVEPVGRGISLRPAITVTFNEVMNETSFAEGFTTSPHLSGTVYPRAGGMAFRFVPDGKLEYETEYFVILSGNIKDVAGNIMGRDYVSNFTTVKAPDVSPPVIEEHGPTGVNVSTMPTLFLKFSEPMWVEWVYLAFNITPEVDMNFFPNENDTRFELVPKRALAGNTLYTVRISPNAKDASGNSIAKMFTFNFTTHESTPPEVERTQPSADAEDVDVNTRIDIWFDEWIRVSDDPDIDISPPVLFDTEQTGNTSLAIIPFDALQYDIRYTVSIKGVRDRYNNSMPRFILHFITESKGAPPEAPRVYRTWPGDGAEEVRVETQIYAVFFDELLPGSVSSDSIVVREDNLTAVKGTVSYDEVDLTLYFVPETPLKYDTDHHVVISGLVSRRDGVPMTPDLHFSFRTEKEPAEGIDVVVEDFVPPRGSESGYRREDVNIWLRFNTPMDFASVRDNLTLSPTVKHNLIAEADTKVIRIELHEDLLPGTKYYLNLSSEALSLQGSPLKSNFSTNFTTMEKDGEEPDESKWYKDHLSSLVVGGGVLIALLILFVFYSRPRKIGPFPDEPSCPHCGRDVLEEDEECWFCKRTLVGTEEEPGEDVSILEDAGGSAEEDEGTGEGDVVELLEEGGKEAEDAGGSPEEDGEMDEGDVVELLEEGGKEDKDAGGSPEEDEETDEEDEDKDTGGSAEEDEGTEAADSELLEEGGKEAEDAGGSAEEDG